MTELNRVLGRLSGVEKKRFWLEGSLPRTRTRPETRGVRYSTDAALGAAGLTLGDLFRRSVRSEPTAMWRIKDAQGTEQATHVRFDGPTDKGLLWKFPVASGWGLKGRARDTPPLYGSERVKYYPDDVPIFVTEGEKATDALLAAKIPAVGTVTGASGAPGDEAPSVLSGRNVVPWPDADDPGRKGSRALLWAFGCTSGKMRPKAATRRTTRLSW